MDVIHPGKANVSKAELKTKLAQMYKVADEKTIFVFGFRSQFGGGKSSGFGLIYDTIAAAKCYEPRYRLVRVCILKNSVIKEKIAYFIFFKFFRKN